MQRMTEEQQKRVTDNYGFALKKASRWKDTPWYDDMKQASLIGMCRAAQLFDPSLGKRFITYAAYHCFAEMRDASRHLRSTVTHSRHSNRAHSLTSSRKFDEKGLCNALEDTREGLSIPEQVEVRRALGELPERDAVVLGAVLAEYRQRDIGKAIGGVTHTRVQFIYKRAMRRLQKRAA